MSDVTSPKAQLDYAIATWVYVLHASGVEVINPDIKGHCEAISAATEATTGNQAGEALVHAISAKLGGTTKDDVVALTTTLFGDRLHQGFDASSRQERASHIRAYQFAKNLPWLSQIYERQPGGEVGPTWLVVERVTDQVTAMDPNPWNDIDEERHLPLSDYHVLWELSGCASVALA